MLECDSEDSCRNISTEKRLLHTGLPWQPNRHGGEEERKDGWVGGFVLMTYASYCIDLTQTHQDTRMQLKRFLLLCTYNIIPADLFPMLCFTVCPLEKAAHIL